MTPFLFEADGPVYLERQNRLSAKMKELEAPDGLDVMAWAKGVAAIQREVDELPLVIGVRYRVKLLGGKMGVSHRHFVDEHDHEIAVDIPVVLDPEYVEFEGRFARRDRTAFGTSAILFDVGGGQHAMIGDCDVLRIEECV